jgi:ribosomal protein S18 acetylase RimI-like enzyme
MYVLAWCKLVADEIEIFECGVKDVNNSLKELWLALAREMFEIEHFTLPSEANGERWIQFVREGLASGKSFLLVARSGSKLVGFAYISVFRSYPMDVSDRVGVINDVYLLSEFRGRGIGERLVVGCIKKLEAEGVSIARLSALVENKAAIKLYEKLGFNVHAYAMTKVLKH